MMEDLKGRVRRRSMNLAKDPNLMRYQCRAATIDGRAVDFEFTLMKTDDRASALQPGNRVTLSAASSGAWGAVIVPGFTQRIPVDTWAWAKAEDPGEGRRASYRDALGLGDDILPPPEMKERAQREAEHMGYQLVFGVEADRSFIEITVPGRGKMKHYKAPGVAWDELMTTAGLGGTL